MELVVWALSTGVISGGVWVAILLRNQRRREGGAVARLRYDLEERLQQLEGADERIAALEERLDFAERGLLRAREADRQTPSVRPPHEE